MKEEYMKDKKLIYIVKLTRKKKITNCVSKWHPTMCPITLMIKQEPILSIYII